MYSLSRSAADEDDVGPAQQQQRPEELKQDMSILKRATSCGGFGASSFAGLHGEEEREEAQQRDDAEKTYKYGSPIPPPEDLRDAAVEERDFDIDSTELFAAIHRRAWKNASLWCRNEPEQARVWIYRHTEDGDIRWKTLPLHAAIMFKAPFALIEELLRAYCPAVSMKDDKGMLPIHLALKVGAAKEKVRVLFDAYPESVDVADDTGALPLDLAKSSRSPFRKAYLNAWASTFYALHNECDFDTNPTKLYMYLQKKDWNKDIEISKADAATWVSRREESGGQLRWRMLPLHAAILFQAPDQIIQSVLRAHPPAAQCKDDRGMLPLHVAIAKRASDNVVTQLLRAFPESIETPDDDGVYPIEVAEISKSPYRDAYIEALERDPSFYKLNDECDFDTNPTGLYLSIEDGNWEVTEYIASTAPEETRTWVSRRSKTGKLKWRMLPLHAAVLFSAPLATISALVNAYPEGASCKDSQGMLPIHTALKNGLPVDVVEHLLMHYPHCLVDQDIKGRTPFTLAEASKSPHKASYQAALDRGPSYYIRQKAIADGEITPSPSERSSGPGVEAYPLTSSVTMDRKASMAAQKSLEDGVTENDERNLSGRHASFERNDWHSPPLPRRSSSKEESHRVSQHAERQGWKNPPIPRQSSLNDSTHRHAHNSERNGWDSPTIPRQRSLNDNSHQASQKGESHDWDGIPRQRSLNDSSHRHSQNSDRPTIPRQSSMRDTSHRHSQKHSKSHSNGHHDVSDFVGKSIVAMPTRRGEMKPNENRRGGATSPTHSSEVGPSNSSPQVPSNPITTTATSPTNQQGDTQKHKVRKMMSKVFSRGNRKKSNHLNSAVSHDEEEPATGDEQLAYTKSYGDVRTKALETPIKNAESNDEGLATRTRDLRNKEGNSSFDKKAMTPDGGLNSRSSIDQGINTKDTNQHQGNDDKIDWAHDKDGKKDGADEGKPTRGASRSAKANRAAGIPRTISPITTTDPNSGSQPEELVHAVSDLTDPSDIRKMQRPSSPQNSQKPVSILRPQKRGGPGRAAEAATSTNKPSPFGIGNIPGLSLLTTVDTFGEKHENVGSSKPKECLDEIPEQAEDEQREVEQQKEEEQLSPINSFENEAVETTPSRRLVVKSGLNKGKHEKSKFLKKHQKGGARNKSPPPSRPASPPPKEKKSSTIEHDSEASIDGAAGPNDDNVRPDTRPPLGRRPLKAFGAKERRRSSRRPPPVDIPLVISVSSEMEEAKPRTNVKTGLKSSLRGKKYVANKSELEQSGLDENPTPLSPSLSIDTMTDVKKTMEILDKHAAKHGVSRNDIINRIGRNGPRGAHLAEDSAVRNTPLFEDSVQHTMSEDSTITTTFHGEESNAQKRPSVGQTLDSAIDKVGEALFENDLMNGLVKMVIPTRRRSAADGEASIGGVSGAQSQNGALSSPNPSSFTLNETGPGAAQSS